MHQKKSLPVLVVFLSLGLVGGCNWFNSRDNLNRGVQAYQASNYPLAVEHFQAALEFDPEVPNAELYLGLSYAGQYVPQIPDTENFADLAIETYLSVLEREPDNTTAIGGLAAIYQSRLDLDNARSYYERWAEVDPENATAHYSAGSVNWHIVNLSNPELTLGDPLAALPLTAEETAMSEEELEAAMAAEDDDIRGLVEVGQQSLDRALELDGNYEDAMIFKNLLYRVLANMIPDDTEDEEALARREEFVALADEWFEEANQARIRNQEEAATEFGVVE